MKRLITILFLLFTTTAYCQRITDNISRVGYLELRANGWFYLPEDTVLSTSTNADPCQQIAKKNSTVYTYDCIVHKWVPIVSNATVLDSAYISNDTLHFPLSTGGEVAVKVTGLPIGNITGLQAALDSKLEPGDTMSLSNRLDSKVNIDTGMAQYLAIFNRDSTIGVSDIRYTPSPRPEFFGLKEYIIGSKPFTTRSAKLMVTDSLVVDSGYHAIGDYSFISQTSGGSAFASFDIATTLGGAFAWSHFFGVQSRPSLTGTGNLTDFYGYQSLLQHYGSGTIANAAGMMIEDVVGSGSVTNQYGIYIKNQTHGANNWALYSAGGNSYFAGNVGIGVSAPTVPLSVNGTIAAGGLTLTTTPYVSSIRSNLISSNYRAGFNIETNGSNNSAISSAPTASPVFRWLWKQSTPVDYTSDTDELMRLTGAGNLGIGNSAPTARIDLNSSTGYNQLRLRTSYTPTGASDTNGSTGDVSWDTDYIYIKTTGGWKRSPLTTF